MSHSQGDEQSAKRRKMFAPIPSSSSPTSSPNSQLPQGFSQVQFVDAQSTQQGTIIGSLQDQVFESLPQVDGAESEKEEESSSRIQQETFDDSFGYEIKSSEVHREMIEDIERIIIRKGSNIKRKLNYVFKKLEAFSKEDNKDEHLEFMFIAKKEQVQKLLTVTEILKQKLEAKGVKRDKFGDRKVTTEMINKIKINGKEVENLKVQSYSQYNYMDYIIRTQNYDLLAFPLDPLSLKDPVAHNLRQEEVRGNLIAKKADLEGLDQELTNVPILYIYLCIHKNEDKNFSPKIKARFEYFKNTSWTRQN